MLLFIFIIGIYFGMNIQILIVHLKDNPRGQEIEAFDIIVLLVAGSIIYLTYKG